MSAEKPGPSGPANLRKTVAEHRDRQIKMEGKASDGSLEVHASSKQQTHGIYWRTPVLMVSSWIVGLIFSIGHHLFYSHFDRRSVRSANEEQWNIRSASLF